jgi:hypothetical protein
LARKRTQPIWGRESTTPKGVYFLKTDRGHYDEKSRFEECIGEADCENILLGLNIRFNEACNQIV